MRNTILKKTNAFANGWIHCFWGRLRLVHCSRAPRYVCPKKRRTITTRIEAMPPI
jgi:hypothetical protein